MGRKRGNRRGLIAPKAPLGSDIKAGPPHYGTVPWAVTIQM
jgi:hypothetical protein